MMLQSIPFTFPMFTKSMISTFFFVSVSPCYKIMEARKYKICRVGWEAPDSGESMVQFYSEGQQVKTQDSQVPDQFTI